MVACDCCNNWYHYSCLGFTSQQQENISKLSPYFCRKCRQWRTYIKEFFFSIYPVNGNNQSHELKDLSAFESESIDKAGVVPSDTSKFTICEFIIITIMLQIKLFRKLSSTDLKQTEEEEESESLEELLIDSAKFIPFNLNGILSSVLKRPLLAQGIDQLVNRVIDLDEYDNIQSIFVLEIESFDQDNVKKLEERINYFKLVRKIYEEQDLPQTSAQKRINEILEKANWMMDLHKSLNKEEKKPENIPLAVVNKLIERADKISISRNIPERKYLETLASRLGESGNQAKKALNQKISTMRSKIAILENVDIQNLPLDEALKALEEIETYCKDALDVKPDIKELQEILKNDQEGDMEIEDLNGIIEKETAKVKEVQKKLTGKKNKGVDDLEKKTNEFSEVAIKLPENIDLMNDIKKAKTAQLKLQYYLKNGIKEKAQENNNASQENKMEEEKENGVEEKKDEDSAKKKGSGKKVKEANSAKSAKNRKNSLEMEEEAEEEAEKLLLDISDDDENAVTLEEIEQVLKECEGVDNKFVKEKKVLKDIVTNIEKLKKKTVDALDGVSDVKELISLRKEFRKYNISFKEKGELKEKCREYKRRREEIANKVFSPEELLNKKEEFGKFFEDAKFQADIKNKVDKVKKIGKDMEKFFTKKTFSRDDIEKRIKGLMEEIQEEKFEAPHKEDIEDLKKSLNWLENLYRFRKSCMAKEEETAKKHKEDKMEEEKTEENKDKIEEEPVKTLMDKKGKKGEKVESSEAKDPETMSVEALIKACDLKDESYIPIYKKYYQEFKEIIAQDENVKHKDQRIEKLAKEHKALYCDLAAGDLHDKHKHLRIEDLNSLYNLGHKIGVESTEGPFGKIAEVHKKYNDWIQGVEEVVSAEEIKHALDEDFNGKEEELNKLAGKADNLVKSYNHIGVEAEEENRILKSVWRILEWAKKGHHLLKMINVGQKVSLEAVEDFIILGEETKVGTTNWLFKKVDEALENLTKLKEEFDDLQKIRKAIKKRIRGYFKDWDPQKRKKALEKLCKKKPHFDKVKDLERRIRESSLYIVSSEIEEMDGEIKKTESWSEKTRSFLEKYGKEIESVAEDEWKNFVLKAENMKAVIKELGSIKNEMRNLTYRVEPLENEMIRFEWLFRSSHLIERQLEKGIGIKGWIKLQKIADHEKREDKKLKNTNLYNEIVKEIQIFEAVFQRLENFKTKENLLLQSWWAYGETNMWAIKRDSITKEEFEILVKDLEESKVDISQEAIRLKTILQSGDQNLEHYEQVINGEFGKKAPLAYIKQLLGAFKMIPIEYTKEESILEEYVKKGEEIGELLIRLTQGHDVVETLNEKYEECPVFIEEAEKVEEEYKKNMEIMKNSQEIQQKENATLEEIQNIFVSFLQVFFDFGGKLEEERKNLWKFKIQTLKKINPETDEIKVASDIMKQWLVEGYQQIKNEIHREELKEEIEWMEQVVQDIEKKVLELHLIKDIEKLNEESCVVHGFVDISKEVETWKERLEKNKNNEANGIEIIEEEEEEETKKENPPKQKDQEMEIEMEIEINQPKENKKEQNKEESLDTNLGKRNFAELNKEEQKANQENNDDDEDEIKEIKIVPHKKIKGENSFKEREAEIRKEKQQERARREEAKKLLNDILTNNPHFESIKPRIRTIVRKLELRLFLEKGLRLYTKTLNKICNLFKALNNREELCEKLIEKDFDFKFIEELSSRNFTEDNKPTPKQDIEQIIEELRIVHSNNLQENQPINAIEIISMENINHKNENIEQAENMQEEKKVEGEIECVPLTASVHKSSVNDIQQKPQINKNEIQIEKDESVVEEIEEIEDLEDEEDEEDIEEEDEFEDEEDYDDDEYDDSVVDLESDEGEDRHKKDKILEEVEENLPVYEKGSILKIHEGRIIHKGSLNRSVSLSLGSSSGVRSCLFYTCEDSQHIRRFPKLSNEISIERKVGQKEAIDFIEELSKTFANTNIKYKPFLVGWIECKRDMQADLTKLAEELLERQRVFLIKYNEYADMYLIHPSMLKKEVSKQLEWYPRVPIGQRKPKIVLLYIIYMREGQFLKGKYEKVNPEFIGMPDQTLQKKETELQNIEIVELEEEGGVSPLTSLGGDDIDNGQSINQMQFNMMNMNMNMMGMPGMPGMGNMGGMRGVNHQPMNFQQIMNQGVLMGQMGGMGYPQNTRAMGRGGHAGNFGTGARGHGAMKGNGPQIQTGRMMKGGMVRGQRDIVVEDLEDDDEDNEEDEDDDEIEEEFDDDDDDDDEDEDEEDEDDIEEIEEVEEEIKPVKKKVVSEIKPTKKVEEIEIEEIDDDDKEEDDLDEDGDEEDEDESEEEIAEEVKKRKDVRKNSKRSEEVIKKGESVEINDDDDMEIIEVNPSKNRSSRNNRRDQGNLLNSQNMQMNMQDPQTQNFLLMHYPQMFNQPPMMFEQMGLQNFEMLFQGGGMGYDQDLTKIFGEMQPSIRKPSKETSAQKIEINLEEEENEEPQEEEPKE